MKLYRLLLDLPDTKKGTIFTQKFIVNGSYMYQYMNDYGIVDYYPWATVEINQQWFEFIDNAEIKGDKIKRIVITKDNLLEITREADNFVIGIYKDIELEITLEAINEIIAEIKMNNYSIIGKVTPFGVASILLDSDADVCTVCKYTNSDSEEDPCTFCRDNLSDRSFFPNI